ncbi:YlbL family protein [Paenibacillus mendelii]|uniref:endopeptidase La n=1 Tax=Paenibacillus mendelii TaxID=206163 RepID=A0ABV6JGQ6_9BACL|nr:S16 family serine protease [Paenibacillus mendelii]MCQ6557960.1 PDZ domain-containing protein [Paenibacillus mendelii]
MGKHRQRTRLLSMKSGWWRWPFCAALVMTLLLYVPTPFAAYEPGIAISTKPLVRAVSPDSPGEGAFFLTTVKLTYANFWMALRSAWDRNIELFMKKDLLKGKTTGEYQQRLSVIMLGSQTDALEAAYRAAGIVYKIAPYALVVSEAGTEAKSGGSGRLLTGDELIEVDGLAVNSLSELAAAIEGMPPGEESEFTVIRNDKQITVRIRLHQVQGEAGSAVEKAAAALGVKQLTELRHVVPDDSTRSVAIDAEGIGGPSAGLMFALQALDELTPGDLTGGFKVAGTGTIKPEGTVGAIGGVGHKVVAADRAGAQLFLVPERNAAEAADKARQIGSGIKVIPVATLSDGVQALKNP